MDPHAISSIWGAPGLDSLRPTTANSSGRNTPSKRFVSGTGVRSLNVLSPGLSPSLGWNLPAAVSSNPGTPSRVKPPPGLSCSTSSALPNNDVDELSRRYQAVRSVDQAKNSLIEDLFELVHAKSGNESPLDASGSQKWRALVDKLTREKEHLERVNQQLVNNSSNRKPYVMAIIDGSALLFDEALLRKGEQGGVEAADILREKIRAYAQTAIDNVTPSTTIVAKVYANTLSLGHVLAHVKIINDPSIFAKFVQGFNSRHSLLDFIDSGPVPLRAEEKIADVLQFHLSDNACRQVIFGTAGADRVASVLEKISEEEVEVNSKRITLIEAGPTEKRIRRLPYLSTSLDGILCPAKAVKMIPPTNQLMSASPVSSTPMSRGSSQQSSARPSSSDATELSRTASPTPNPSSNTWAKVTKAKTAAPMVPDVDVSTKQSSAITNFGASFVLPMNREAVAMNRRGQRVDPPVKHDKDEVDRVKRLKICNFHYLSGHCPNPSCAHRHDYKPTTKELTFLSLVARMAPCRFGNACGDARCIYGHICPAPEGRNGEDCIFGSTCRFPPEMHKVDRAVVKFQRC